MKYKSDIFDIKNTIKEKDEIKTEILQETSNLLNERNMFYEEMKAKKQIELDILISDSGNNKSSFDGSLELIIPLLEREIINLVSEQNHSNLRNKLSKSAININHISGKNENPNVLNKAHNSEYFCKNEEMKIISNNNYKSENESTNLNRQHIKVINDSNKNNTSCDLDFKKEDSKKNSKKNKFYTQIAEIDLKVNSGNAFI